MMLSTMPFKTSVVCTYLNWLVFDCNYALNYIKIHIGILKKCYNINFKYKILPNEQQEIAHCYKELKKNHLNKNQGFGKAPCVYHDLKHILKSVPKNYRKKNLISSLAMLSFMTAARRVSCLLVRLKRYSGNKT